MGDGSVAELVQGARALGSGIGGTTFVASVGGISVFCKLLPLTDLEGRSDNLRSTANLYRLPPFCHYGVGSPGMGAWRELATHLATTRWVLGGVCANFPILYHWRVLPLPAFPGPLPAELGDVDRMATFWAGSSAVRARLVAIGRACRSLLLVCESIPDTVSAWLSTRMGDGPTATDAALAMVDTELGAAVSVLNARGWLHFDAHFDNALTDGHTVYLADFGLAASRRFAMTDDERAFVRTHAGHDRAYVATEVANWIVREMAGARTRPERMASLRHSAAGNPPPGVAGVAARLLATYAPTAVVMNGFYGTLIDDGPAAPFPADALRRLRPATRSAP